MKSSRKADVAIIGAPEAALTRELEKRFSVIEQILRETVKNLPKERRCVCAGALKKARFGG